MKYEYHIDQKITIWERNKYLIEAATELEADAKAKLLFEDVSSDEKDGFVECTILYETQEEMTVAENQNCSTKELLRSRDGEPLLSNAEIKD